MNAPLAKPTPMRKPLSYSPLPSSFVEARQTLSEHVAGCGDGSVRVIGCLDRRPERRHHSVAAKAEVATAVIEHRVAHLTEEQVEHLERLFGGRRLRVGGEVADVVEQDRSFDERSAETEIAAAEGNDAVDDLLWDKSREHVADAFTIDVMESLLRKSLR